MRKSTIKLTKAQKLIVKKANLDIENLYISLLQKIPCEDEYYAMRLLEKTHLYLSSFTNGNA